MKTLIIILITIFALSCTTSDLQIYEAPGESIQKNIALEASAYPIQYFARIVDTTEYVELKTDTLSETSTIIHLMRVFKMKRFANFPSEERWSEWQDYTVTSPLFWTKFAQHVGYE